MPSVYAHPSSVAYEAVGRVESLVTGQPVIVVVVSGRNVDEAQFREWIA
jgi:hypothetical protein